MEKINEHRRRHHRNPRHIIGTLLFISLVLSVVYAAARFVLAPVSAPVDQAYAHVKSDYALMFLQCLLGIGVLALPSLFSKKWNLDIPNFIYIMYYVFLYCAIFLGEVFSFYYLIPYWDTILHFFSGAMLGALGFILVEWLNEDEHIRISLSPSFVALFAFCFALSCGAIWEIYEFLVDDLFRTNMQKFTLADGTLLTGHAALVDTMKDIIVDALAAFLMSLLGYMRLKAHPHQKQEALENELPENA